MIWEWSILNAEMIEAPFDLCSKFEWLIDWNTDSPEPWGNRALTHQSPEALEHRSLTSFIAEHQWTGGGNQFTNSLRLLRKLKNFWVFLFGMDRKETILKIAKTFQNESLVPAFRKRLGDSFTSKRCQSEVKPFNDRNDKEFERVNSTDGSLCGMFED